MESNLENSNVSMNHRKDFDSDSRRNNGRFRGEKRAHRDDSQCSSSSRSSRSSCGKPKEKEFDADVLARRQKQIDYGKNGVAYDNYVNKVPKDKRSFNLPRTPDKNVKYSRRQWDGLIKAWKLQIHSWNAKGDTDVFQKIDEWQNKEEDDPILGGPSKEKYSTKNEKVYRPFHETFKNEKEATQKETVPAKSGELSRSFTFNWSEEVNEEEKELQKRRKKD